MPSAAAPGTTHMGGMLQLQQYHQHHRHVRAAAGKRNLGEKLGAELLDVVTGQHPKCSTWTLLPCDQHLPVVWGSSCMFPPSRALQKARPSRNWVIFTRREPSGYVTKACTVAVLLHTVPWLLIPPTHTHINHTHINHVIAGGPKMRKWYGQESNSNLPRDGGEQPDQQVGAAQHVGQATPCHCQAGSLPTSCTPACSSSIQEPFSEFCTSTSSDCVVLPEPASHPCTAPHSI